jgi:hypothetical protein
MITFNVSHRAVLSSITKIAPAAISVLIPAEDAHDCQENDSLQKGGHQRWQVKIILVKGADLDQASAVLGTAEA